MDNPLVSVIVPTYKRKPKLIKRAIKSILRQTYKNIELIVVDDSPSNYKYRSDVEGYIKSIKDKRVKYIKHSKNLGANKARNTGISISSGAFCAFLDDDDEWIENKVELQLAEFTSPTIGLVYCKAIVVNEQDQTIRPMLNEIKRGYYYEELLKQNFIGSNSYVMIRTDVLNEVGQYDEELDSNQDYDLFLRIAKSYEIAGVEKVLVRYFDHSGERITNNFQKQLQGRLGLYKKYKKDILNDNELKLIWEIKNVPLYYRAGKRKKAIGIFLKIITKDPLFLLKYLKRTITYRKKLDRTTVINKV